MTTAPVLALDLFDDEVKANPYPRYVELRDAGPAVSNPVLFGQYLVGRHEDVAAVLHDAATFSSAGISGLGGEILQAATVLNSDPPDHGRLRGVVSRAFTPRSVWDKEPAMRTMSEELVRPLADGAEIDLVTEVAEKLPVLVIADMLGVSADDREDFTAWSHGLLGVLDPLGSAETQQRAQDCSAKLHEYFAEEVGRRRAGGPVDDLIGRMVAANDDGQLSDAEMLASCVLLLLAGHETTTKLITNAALALLRNPGERGRLAADPSLLPTAAEELLRYDTPVQAVVRVTTREVCFGGVDLPEAALVIALLGSANHDDRVFENPSTLDLGRDPNPHLGFGRGAHFCLGANLARLEARAVLGALMAAAPEFSAVEDVESLEYSASFFLRAPTRFRISR